MDKQVRKKITTIFRKELNNPSLVLHDETVVTDIKGWDSLKQVALIIFLEKEFNISFKGSEIRSIKKYRDLEDIVLKKISRV